MSNGSLDELEAPLDPSILSEDDVVSEEELEEACIAFLEGDLTLAQLEGFTLEELYAIANLGYDLMLEGKLDDARKIFEGLVAYNPHDPYFHSALGSALQKLERFDEAVEQYRMATDLNPNDISALANLGEIRLQQSGALQNSGSTKDAVRAFEEAVGFLKKAVELDRDNANPSAKRARALLIVTASMAEASKAQ